MNERALMLVARGLPLVLDIVDSSDLSAPGLGQDVVAGALHELRPLRRRHWTAG